MTKEAVTSQLLIAILEGLRYLIKKDSEIHIINVRVVLRDNPDLSKCGSVTVKYPYQNK